MRMRTDSFSQKNWEEQKRVVFDCFTSATGVSVEEVAGGSLPPLPERTGGFLK